MNIKIKEEIVLFKDVDAITFDDFNTLRYQVGKEEDIIYTIISTLETKIEINKNEFLEAYFKVDRKLSKNPERN